MSCHRSFAAILIATATLQTFSTESGGFANAWNFHSDDHKKEETEPLYKTQGLPDNCYGLALSEATDLGPW